MSRPVRFRKRWPKGTWMTLISADTLRALMDQKSFTGARLARAADKSEAFISQLRNGKKWTCKPRTAELIAEALDVPRELLFMDSSPSTATRNVKQEKVAA